jgi:rSAM/selenodomain-associated transferase 2
MAHTQLSVIVPALNEEETLPELFRTLSEQEGVPLELVISDGGSTDGTVELARRLGDEAPFPVIILETEQGRARQMNAGAAASRGETLLFLHADSVFGDCRALRSALDLLNREILEQGDGRIAGRFSLCFDRRDIPPSLPYFYYESKALLDRPECCHGDQGFMLKRRFFSEVGPFDGSITMLAETRLAETVREKGKWLLFPEQIITSARRFESEGHYGRQVMNAIIMNFAAQGWETFFRELPGIYSGNNRSRRLPLAAMLEKIDGLMAALPFSERLSLWYRTGAYVRSHAWQIPFFLDTRRNFRRGVPPGTGATPLLDLHDRCLDRLTDHPPGRLAAAILTWLWFRITRIYLRKV